MDLDKETKNHIFRWKTQEQRRAARLQIWFNATVYPKMKVIIYFFGADGSGKTTLAGS